MKVIDTIPFCGEFDLLEIRLNCLKNIVSETIILESNYSHTLIPKPLFFLEQKARFEQFNIRYVIGDFKHDNPFHNDANGRIALFEAIEDKDSLIIHGDLDEIPNPEKLQNIIENIKQPTVLGSEYYFFCLDLWGRKDNSNILMKYNWVREPLWRYRDGRHTKFFTKEETAGWHFSSVGTPEDLARKWKFFAHSLEVNEKYKDAEYIKKQIKRKAGSWDEKAPDGELKLVEHFYPNLPNYLLQNKDKYKHLFYNYYA